ncbi:MAG TPA: hypothetical protein VGL89_12670 [Candidatus Koribacter sp.]
MTNSEFDDARLCLVLSAAILTVACATVFALTIGSPDGQTSWGVLLLPAYLPLQYAFHPAGNGPVIQLLVLVLDIVLSFAFYFFATFGIMRAYRRSHRH